MAADFRAAAADPRRLATGDDERELFFELSRMSHPFKGNPKIQESSQSQRTNTLACSACAWLLLLLALAVLLV